MLLNSVVVADPNQLSADLNGESVILDMKSGVYYGLNEVGSRVWSLIQQPTPIRQIQKTLLNEYDVEPEQCERDLLTLLEDMIARNMVSIQAPVQTEAQPEHETID